MEGKESMKPFIAVTSDILESLEKIMHSGLRGTHLLFTNHMIREAFENDIPLDLLSDESRANQVQQILSDLVEIEDLEDRQDYIQALDKGLRDLLVHLYFGFLDKFMDNEEKPEVLH